MTLDSEPERHLLAEIVSSTDDAILGVGSAGIEGDVSEKNRLDVSEKSRLNDAVRESESRFRIMADGCPAFIWVTDAEGALWYTNRTFCEFSNVSFDMVGGQQWQRFLHPEDVEAYVGEFRRSVAERSAFHYETRVRRRDGIWRWISSCAEPRI